MKICFVGHILIMYIIVSNDPDYLTNIDKLFNVNMNVTIINE